MSTAQSFKTTSHEETFLDFEIYIEPNPDPYREGLIWSELDDGWAFEFNNALQAARSAAQSLGEK